MDNVLETPMQPAPAQTSSLRVTVSLEVLAYVALLLFALALRVFGLNDVPLSAGETHNALAAWRAIIPDSSGDPLLATSPLLFLAQSAGFGLLGGSEMAARLFTAVAGGLLVLAPSLFRRQLGAGYAFAWSVFLAASPMLLAGSWLASPAIWSFAALTLSLWASSRWGETRRPAFGIAAIVGFAALLFLSEAGGIVLAIILLLALLAAGVWQRRGERFTFDEDGANNSWQEMFRSLPWGLGLPVALLVVLIAATGLMLYPAGLSILGEVVAGVPRALTQVASFQPVGLALINSLFYETWVWGLGIVGLIVLWRRGELTLIDRFLALWVLFGSLASLIFQTGDPVHALWTTVPLAGLSARLLLWALAYGDSPAYWDIPFRARFVVALAVLAILLIFTAALQEVGRALANAPDGVLNTANIEPAALILVFVTVILFVVVAFMAASFWESRATLQGIVLALIAFGLFTSLGAGWNAAVTRSADPTEPLHFRAVSRDTQLIRVTLLDVADRQAQGFSTLPIAVLAPQDGIEAWLVRDFPNARFITEPSEARGEEVVLFEPDFEPDLGGAYVGQDFKVAEVFDPTQLPILSFPSWWMQRVVEQSGEAQISVETSFLWLRQDIWAGVSEGDRG